MVTQMLNIRIKTISHHYQQYETVGNYWRDLDAGQEVLENPGVADARSPS